MAAVVVTGLLALLCFGLSLTFFCGRGAMLIAGYNTATDDQRSQYDMRKLSKTMGFMMLICTVCLALMAIVDFLELRLRLEVATGDFAYLLSVMTLIANIVVGVWWANTRCLKS